MKKIVAIAAACACLALSVCMLAGCSSSDNKSTMKDNTLIVGFDSEYPPYGYVGEDGEYTGFDLELAKAVCEVNGWTFKAEAIDWDAKDALIESGTVTCIWNGFTLEGREDSYSFSNPYMKNSQVIVTKADSTIASQADLAGKTVLTQAESAAQEALESEDFAELKSSLKSLDTIADYNNAFLQLEAGLVDAVACDYSIYMYQAASKADTYKIAVTLTDEHYAVGFKLGQTELAEQVNTALAKLVSDGTVEKLVAKYADQGISMQNWCFEASN